jgi:hypothetical protein
MMWNNYPGIQAWQISNTDDNQSTHREDGVTQKGASPMRAPVPGTSRQGSFIRMMLKTIAPEWAKRIYRRART